VKGKEEIPNLWNVLEGVVEKDSGPIITFVIGAGVWVVVRRCGQPEV